MSKSIKAMITDVYRSRYADADGACVVDLTGLDVKQQEQLRRTLREASAEVQVVKNSLAKAAMRDTPLEPLGNALEGPCAIVVSSTSLIEAAKALAEAAKEFESLTLKHALLDGDPELIGVAELAKMKGRLELLGELAMLVASPGRAIAGCLSSPQGKIAGCLKAIADKE